MHWFRSLVWTATLVCATGCGLAENEQDEENKYRYITFSDPAFAAYCLAHFDLNGDSRISLYEAQRVREIACSALAIENLYQINEFTNLERLDCSGNLLTSLDVRRCEQLQAVNCSYNRISSLDVSGLRGLTSLNCGDNNLNRLDVQTNISLTSLSAGANVFPTLDVSSCSRNMELVDVLRSPRLTTLYRAAAQSIRTLRYEAPTEIVVL